LTDEVVQAVQERIPEFGQEPQRRQRKRLPAESATTIVLQNEGSITDPIIPEEVIPVIQDTLPTTPTSLGPALDPEISALLGDLERRPVRNAAINFLASLGFVEPQLSLEQKTIVDREGLLAYLLEHDANSVTRFCGLIQSYTEASDREQLPYIDVPIMDPITLYIYRKLDLYPCGIQWLRKVVAWKDINGSSLTNREIRQNLFNFMKENGIMTFDAVIAMAKEKHCEIVGEKKAARDVSPEQFGIEQYVH